MSKSIVQTDQAPAAAGPYSQAVVVNKMVFCAGQIPLIPGTRTFVEGGIEEQTRQALTNLKAVLEAAGAAMDNVVKTTVFLQDMNHFAAMNGVYATFFRQQPPARSTVQVARLPLDALVEVEAIAVLD
ncbi:MAG: RidA family protein [Chloroflexi bacterium]|nr:RidA family protein [Chloroflexota bacterium]